MSRCQKTIMMENKLLTFTNGAELTNAEFYSEPFQAKSLILNSLRIRQMNNLKIITQKKSLIGQPVSSL